MKKIMLSSVILLPLIILLIMLISSSIVSITSHVYVDALEFADGDTTITLYMDDESNPPTHQLRVNVLPVAASNKTLIYESKDSDIVTVNQEGLITAKGYGQTVVTVTSQDNKSKILTATVKVVDDQVHHIKITDNIDTLYVGQSATLHTEILPKEALDQRLHFTSSDPDSIYVSDDGVITVRAYSSDKVTITAISDVHPNVSASIQISIKNPVTSITLADPSTEFAGMQAIFPQVTLNEGADETITYTSSDTDVATVVQDNGEVKVVFAAGSKGKSVIITASATDGLKNTVAVSKTYYSTEGYYTSVKFSQDKYVFDYATLDTNQPLDITLITEQPDATQGFKSVKITSDSDAVRFDEQTHKFYAQNPGTAKIEYVVVLYNNPQYTATCYVELQSHTSSIVFKPDLTEGVYKLSNPSYYILPDLQFNPQGHTDKITYECNSEIASVNDSGIVTFTTTGQADVTIKTLNAEGTQTASVTVKLSYSETTSNDIKFSINNNETNNYRTALTYTEITVTIENAQNLIDKKDTFTMEVIKSNATVAQRSTRNSGTTVTRVYRVTYKEAGEVILYGHLDSTEQNKVLAQKYMSITTTYGASDEDVFHIYNDDVEINADSVYEISSVGSYIDFIIKKTGDITPNDFVFNTSVVKTEVDPRILSTLTSSISGNIRVRVTAKQGTYDGPVLVRFIVAGRVKTVKVKVNVLANQLIVKCNGTQLNEQQTYKTLLGQLNFTLVASRTDGLALTSNVVAWQCDTASGNVVSGGTVSININPSNLTSITFTCGNASVVIKIEYTTTIDDFGLLITYDSGREVFSTDSVVADNDVTIQFPARQTLATFAFTLPDTYLGQFTDTATFSNILSLDIPDGWQQTVNPFNTSIIVRPNTLNGYYSQTVTITQGENTFKYTLMRSDIVSQIEFVGHNTYDGTSTNSTGVYRGYQQIRVFAKRSYFANIGEVDYYRMPISVGGTLEHIVWELTGYQGAESTGVITTQNGRTVYYNDKTYTVIDGGILQDEFGNKVVQNGKNPSGITYVDCFAEDGYVHIYFGNFDGLNESDIESNNFGFFDMNVEGRTFDETKTGRFLRVTASDGVKDSDISCSFNFNVVNDVFDVKTADPDDLAKPALLEENFAWYNTDELDYKDKKYLVNVFDAKGYEEYGYLVMQTDLYGPDENMDESLTLRTTQTWSNLKQNQDPDKVDLFQSYHTGKIRTSLIYGNGYSINFKAQNDTYLNAANKKAFVPLGRVYNTVLKGTTVHEGESKDDYRVLFEGTRFYYTDVQAVYKGLLKPNFDNMPIYIKNTSIKYASNCAIELWKMCNPGDAAGEKQTDYNNRDKYNGYDNYFIENVTFVDCVKGIEATKVIGDYYFKGFIDAFNYQTQKELIYGLVADQEGLRDLILSMLDFPPYPTIIANFIKPLMDNYKYTIGGNDYANVIILASDTETDVEKKEYKFYDYTTNTYVTGISDSGTGLVRAIGADDGGTNGILGLFTNFHIGGWTYRTDYNFINANCQKKVVDGKVVENTSHMAWHTNRVYRDLSIIHWYDDPEAQVHADYFNK